MWRLAIAAFVFAAVVLVVTAGVLWTMRCRGHEDPDDSAHEPELLLPPSPAEEGEEDEESSDDSAPDSGTPTRRTYSVPEATSSRTENGTRAGGPADPLPHSPPAPAVPSPPLNYGSTDLHVPVVT